MTQISPYIDLLTTANNLTNILYPLTKPHLINLQFNAVISSSPRMTRRFMAIVEVSSNIYTLAGTFF
jgi:hypothetical protein